VIDDHVDTGTLRNHLVLTRPAHGLQPVADVLRAIAMFRRSTGAGETTMLVVDSRREEHMNVSRRDLAVGAVALGASSLLLRGSAGADTGDEAVVTQNVEALRKAWLESDRAKLEQLTAPQLSYGHSDGRAESKEQFIHGVMTRKQVVKSLAFPDLKVAVVGNAAIARHIFLAESELDGKATTTKIGALQVWQKQDGSWKLLARQGFRLPT